MAVTKYAAEGKTFWKVDLRINDGGHERRKRKGRIPTKERALALEAKWRAESFDGRFFDRAKESRLTVAQAWKNYRPAAERNDSFSSDKSRSVYILRHLGTKQAAGLTQGDVDGYRRMRRSENTRRGGPPSSATLDREVELLKRMLAYAVACHKLRSNPLTGVPMLNEPNVRRTVIAEETFQAGLAKVGEDKRSAWMVPVLLVAYDTGMRISEVLNLRRDQVDWQTGRVELAAEDTKTEKARAVYLSTRALEAIKALPAHVRSPLVFWGKNGKPHSLPRRGFHLAFGDGVWVHDLRRSFVTIARRKGVPESVVMKLSGHKTRSVFDRYNIVEEEDVRAAQERLDTDRRGHILDTVPGKPDATGEKA